MSTNEIDKSQFKAVSSRLMSALKIKNEYNLAELLGFKKDSFSARKKRGALPVDKIRLLCSDKGINFDWVMTGQGEASLKVDFGGVEWKGLSREGKPPALTAADMVRIPLYSAVAEGGPGAINDHAAAESYLSFTREYARVQFGSTGNSLACLKAAGDSMSPYINAGDVLIVDVSDRRLTKDGAAYVLQIEETTVVKRLHRLSKDRISIRSDNPHGWNKECDFAEMEATGIAISGRVVAVIKMA
jgi:SOS-response transcriptional repressor LexA